LRAVLCLSALLVSQAAIAGPPQEEPPYERYYAEVVRVIDGDTLEVRVRLWPGLIAEYAIRVRGIDASEIRRPGCEEERALGLEAKARVEALYPVGSMVRLDDVEYGAFAGRVVADVWRWRTDRWLSLAGELQEKGLALGWSPDQTDIPWCLLLLGGEPD